jgi:hypothetical protein
VNVLQKIQKTRLIVCASVLIAGCGQRTEKELSRATSPDGTVVASVVQVDPGGGATVAFSTYVYLSEAGHGRSRKANFHGYSCGPLSVAWKDGQVLEVAYPQRCRILEFNNEWWTYTNSTDARMVELVLRRVETQPNQ